MAGSPDECCDVWVNETRHAFHTLVWVVEIQYSWELWLAWRDRFIRGQDKRCWWSRVSHTPFVIRRVTMNMKLARQLCQLLFGEIRTFIFWKYILQFFFTYSMKYTYLLGYLLILLRPSKAQYPSPFPGSSLRPLSRIRERTLGARLLHANSELQNQTYDYVFTAVNPNCWACSTKPVCFSRLPLQCLMTVKIASVGWQFGCCWQAQ